MLRGILAGGLWGAVIGAIVLALSSQIADWRDLTPAVTKAQSEDAVNSPTVADVVLEPPVVTAGVRADRPTPTDTPAQAIGIAGETLAPALRTEAPTAPSAAEPPAPVQLAVPVDEPPASPSDTTGSAPDAADLATVGTPAADPLPELTATDTAPSPARFGPDSSDEVAELSLDPSDESAPSAPETGETTPALSRDRSDAPALVADAAPETPASPVAPVLDVAGETADSLVDEASDAPAVTSDETVAPAIQTEAPDGLAAAEAEESPELEAGGSPEVVADATGVPRAAEAPAVAEQPSVDALAPERDAAAEAPVSEPIAPSVSEPEPEPLEIAQADPPTEPRIIRRGGEEEDGSARVRRLPTVGDPVEPGEAVEEAAVEEEAADDVASAALPAREANAIDFEAPDAAALISIVLVHGAASEAPTETAIPLTFAVPAWLPGAADVAADYRTAGHEVVLIPDLPPNPTAQDVEVALSVTLEEMPLAVGLIDPDGAGFQANRDATAQVVAAAARTGHGVLSASRGFNSAARLAARDGVAAATVERSIAPELEDLGAIGRVLDQAAFRARNDGVAVIVGEASEAHLAGVLAWASENAGDELAIAPVSAVLQSGPEEQ